LSRADIQSAAYVESSCSEPAAIPDFKLSYRLYRKSKSGLLLVEMSDFGRKQRKSTVGLSVTRHNLQLESGRQPIALPGKIAEHNT
jgi:hypothetical protein